MSAAAITTTTTVDDAALIRAAQQGDDDAFEQLVRSHDEGVLRLAMNLLRSPEGRAGCISGSVSAGVPEPAQIPLRLQLPYVALPDRDESLSGPPRANAGCGGRTPRLSRPRRARATGWTSCRKSGLKMIPQRALLSSEIGDRIEQILAEIDTAGADGIRAAALPGTAASGHWRGSGDDRRGREELPVSSDTEDARVTGRFCMTCERVRKQFSLYLYGELSIEEREQVAQHLNGVRRMPE